MSFKYVEQVWDLAESCTAHQAEQGAPLSLEAWWREVFSTNDLVDQERSLREGGNPPSRIFLTSPYGLQYRPESKDWIPFRHGEVQVA